jgi:hypothetical protein
LVKTTEVHPIMKKNKNRSSLDEKNTNSIKKIGKIKFEEYLRKKL